MATVHASVKLTPAMMAEAFWELGSVEQAEFFSKLAKVIMDDHEGGNTSAYALGELQWFHLGEELDKPENKDGRSLLMSIAAPHYMYTLMACEKW